MKTIIISGGDLDYEFAAAFIQKEKPDCLIAADRGMQFCYDKKIYPDYVMGDFDSAHKEAVSYFYEKKSVHILDFPPEKDDSDTEIAMKKAIELGSRQIFILGALGGRMDHCLANIHILKLALDKNVEACLVDKQNYISLHDSDYILKKEQQYGSYVSFLPFSDQVEGLTLEGFKYPLKDYTMRKGLSIGISNVLVREQGQILIKDGLLLMIQSKDE